MYYYSTFAFDHKSEFDKQHKRGSLIQRTFNWWVRCSNRLSYGPEKYLFDILWVQK